MRSVWTAGGIAEAAIPVFAIIPATERHKLLRLPTDNTPPPSSSSTTTSLSSATKDRGVTSKSAPYDKPPPPYDHSSAPSSPFDRSSSPSVSSPSAATMYSSSRNQQGGAGAGAGAGAVGVHPSIPAPPPPHGQQSRASTLAPSNSHHNPAPSLLYASHAPQNGVGGGGVKIGVSLEGTTVSGEAHFHLISSHLISSRSAFFLPHSFFPLNVYMLALFPSLSALSLFLLSPLPAIPNLSD